MGQESYDGSKIRNILMTINRMAILIILTSMMLSNFTWIKIQASNIDNKVKDFSEERLA